MTFVTTGIIAGSKPLHPLVSAFRTNIIAAGGTIDYPTLTAHDTFARTLDAAGISTKIDEMYTFCGSNLAASMTKFKFTTASAYLTPMNFVSADYAQATGIKPNATTKYIKTGYLDNTRPLTNISFGGYQTTAPTPGSKILMGTLNSASQLLMLRSTPNTTPDSSDISIGSTCGNMALNGNKGFITATRTGSTTMGSNNAAPFVGGTAGGTATGNEFYLCGANAGGTFAAGTEAGLGFAFFGQYLTGAEVQILTDALYIFFEGIGRRTRAEVPAYLASTVLPAITTVIDGGALLGKTIWLAASGYAVGAAMDTLLSTTAYPAGFPDSAIATQMDVYIGTPDGSGNPAAFVAHDSHPYYQAGDLGSVGAHHCLGDAVWAGPIWAEDHWIRTGTLTKFNQYKVQMDASLMAIPRDPGTTHLVYVPLDPATVWRTFGFQDGLDKGGNDLFGSAWAWWAFTKMANLYTAAGDPTNAARMTTEANNIAANISTLYDSTSGMFFSCSSGPNSVMLDITGSAFMVYIGLATTAQAVTVCAWLAAHYTSVVDANGFIFQSTANWPGNRASAATGYGVGSYDDGTWAFGFMWVIYCLNQVDKAAAAKTLRRNMYGLNVSMEWWRRQGYSGTFNGNVNNMCSIYQTLGAMTII